MSSHVTSRSSSEEARITARLQRLQSQAIRSRASRSPGLAMNLSRAVCCPAQTGLRPSVRLTALDIAEVVLKSAIVRTELPSTVLCDSPDFH